MASFKGTPFWLIPPDAVRRMKKRVEPPLLLHLNDAPGPRIGKFFLCQGPRFCLVLKGTNRKTHPLLGVLLRRHIETGSVARISPQVAAAKISAEAVETVEAVDVAEAAEADAGVEAETRYGAWASFCVITQPFKMKEAHFEL